MNINLGGLDAIIILAACVAGGAVTCLLMVSVFGPKASYVPLAVPYVAIAFSDLVPWFAAGVLGLLGHLLMAVVLKSKRFTPTDEKTRNASS